MQSLQSMLQRWTSWCRIVQGPSTHGKFLEECVYLIIFSGWFFSHVVEDLFGQVILSKWFLGFTYELKNLFGRQNLNSEEKWQSKNLKEFVMSTFSFNFIKYKFKEILYFKLYFCGKRCLVGEFNCFPK